MVATAMARVLVPSSFAHATTSFVRSARQQNVHLRHSALPFALRRPFCDISFAARQRVRSHYVKLSVALASQASGDLLTEDANKEEDSIAEEDWETCEIVQGSNVVLGEGEDTFQGYLIQAIKNNNGIAVLCLTDILGFEDSDTRDFAYRLACFGYNVLVPDLFRGNPYHKGGPEDDYEVWRAQHTPDRLAIDIDVAVKYLVDEIAGTEKLGLIGFCFGAGRMIETLARDSSHHFAAGAFLYGTRFDLSLATQIKAPLLLISGDLDESCPKEVVLELERQVKGSKAKVYSGLGHGFAHHPKSSEDDEAAEDAFNEVKQWLHDHLGSNPKP